MQTTVPVPIKRSRDECAVGIVNRAGEMEDMPCTASRRSRRHGQENAIAPSATATCEADPAIVLAAAGVPIKRPRDECAVGTVNPSGEMEDVPCTENRHSKRHGQEDAIAPRYTARCEADPAIVLAAQIHHHDNQDYEDAKAKQNSPLLIRSRKEEDRLDISRHQVTTSIPQKVADIIRTFTANADTSDEAIAACRKETFDVCDR